MNRERRIEQLEFELAERGADILELRNQLAEARAEIEHRDRLLSMADHHIEHRDRLLSMADHHMYDQNALIEQMRSALKWYKDRVSNCNRSGDAGEISRDQLAKDVGKRAKAALTAAERGK